jgi:hypothetical protein
LLLVIAIVFWRTILVADEKSELYIDFMQLNSSTYYVVGTLRAKLILDSPYFDKQHVTQVQKMAQKEDSISTDVDSMYIPDEDFEFTPPGRINAVDAEKALQSDNDFAEQWHKLFEEQSPVSQIELHLQLVLCSILVSLDVL